MLYCTMIPPIDQELPDAAVHTPREVEFALTRWQHVSAWNDVMSAINVQLLHFSPDLIRNNEALGFFLKRSLQQKEEEQQEGQQCIEIWHYYPDLTWLMSCRSRWNTGHRPLACLHPALSCAVLYTAVHVSFSRSLLQVFLGCRAAFLCGLVVSTVAPVWRRCHHFFLTSVACIQ